MDDHAERLTHDLLVRAQGGEATVAANERAALCVEALGSGDNATVDAYLASLDAGALIGMLAVDDLRPGRRELAAPLGRALAPHLDALYAAAAHRHPRGMPDPTLARATGITAAWLLTHTSCGLRRADRILLELRLMSGPLADDELATLVDAALEKLALSGETTWGALLSWPGLGAARRTQAVKLAARRHGQATPWELALARCEDLSDDDVLTLAPRLVGAWDVFAPRPDLIRLLCRAGRGRGLPPPWELLSPRRLARPCQTGLDEATGNALLRGEPPFGWPLASRSPWRADPLAVTLPWAAPPSWYEALLDAAAPADPSEEPGEDELTELGRVVLRARRHGRLRIIPEEAHPGEHGPGESGPAGRSAPP